MELPRFSKRIGSSEELSSVCKVEPVLMVDSSSEILPLALVPMFVGYGSFCDKLMNQVNLAKNVGIVVDSLDADYNELTDNDDVMTSRGD
ncbi:unnamed protein product [Prunus armeniaca]